MSVPAILKFMTLAAAVTLAGLVSATPALAIPVDRSLGQAASARSAYECPSAQDSGLNRTQKDLVQLASIISANGKDPRTTQDRSGKGNQFAPIGALRPSIKTVVGGKDVWNANTKTKAQGTAFLVSPCLILTNRHVVFGNDPSPKNPSESLMTFEAGERGSTNYEVATARPIKWGYLSNDESTENDWALMQLDRGPDGRCIGDRIGWLNLQVDANQKATTGFTSAGFPADRSDAKLIIQKGCKLISGNGNAQTECAAVRGNSGGPIMMVPKSGAPTVVGMTTRTADATSNIYKTMDKTNVNDATQITDVMIGIIEDVENDRANKLSPLDVPSATGAT